MRGEAFTVGCNVCGGAYPWTRAQMLKEYDEPQVGDVLAPCDNAGCSGTVIINGDISWCLVLTDEELDGEA